VNARAVLVALVMALAAAAPAAAEIRVERASDGGVTASLTYDQRSDHEFATLRLSIVRDGTEALRAVPETRQCADSSCMPAGHLDSSSLKVADLDGDGEREVVVDLFTGGAHCCLQSLVYHWTGSTYASVQHDWGDPGYELVDLDRDGTPEFRSADARFAYAFASFASSAMPLVIWRYGDGAFRDVTLEHRALLRADAKGWWRKWRRRRGRPDDEPLGALSAWAADHARLGRWAIVRRELRRSQRRGWLSGSEPWPHGRGYARALERFLRRADYLP
jgi:hypothetical protein